MFTPKKPHRLSRIFSRLMLSLLLTGILILLFAIYDDALYGLFSIPFFAAFLVLVTGHHRCPNCGELLLGDWWPLVFLLPFIRLRHIHWLDETESGLALHLSWNKADAGYCDFCGYRLLYDDQP